VKPAPFAYHRARSLEDALEVLATGDEDAKILAGGQSLVAMMNLRLARPSLLVDINDLPGLSYVLEEGEGLRVGALARHSQLEWYPGDAPGFAILPQAARWVGHYPIRARGTFGGSIAHADAAAEWCILAVLLEAEIVARSPRGIRTIPAESFFQGLFTTALQQDEVLTEVRLPRGYDCAAIDEFARRHGDFAIVAAAVAYDLEGGLITRPRVVLGGVADRPADLAEVAELLDGEQPSHDLFTEAGQLARTLVDPPSDIHGSAEYRRDLAAALVQRALIAADDV
jgi:aerobic carbon-monoxide dehydrogenase medium subunit